MGTHLHNARFPVSLTIEPQNKTNTKKNQHPECHRRQYSIRRLVLFYFEI